MLIFCVVFILLGTTITGCFPLYNTIEIDKEKGIITFKKFSICICCWKKTICSIKDIKEIYSEKGTSKYTYKRKKYNSFNIVVELINGSNIIAIKGEIDYENRKEGVLNFLYNSLPTLVRVNNYDFMNTGINPSYINNNFPVYSTNNGNMIQPQYYQGQQPNYIHLKFSIILNILFLKI